MPVIREGKQDTRLKARVVSRERLYYSAGSDASLDRPEHVRSGSALAYYDRERLVVVQDDANFLAWVNTETGAVESTTLDYVHEGQRLFDESRGNKQFKLDLESCVIAETHTGPTLFAFGSGSTIARENVVIVQDLLGTRNARIVDAHGLYEAFRQEVNFCGAELNIEGTALVDGRTIRFFQRGNGSKNGDRAPVDATCDVSIERLMRYLAAPAFEEVPVISNVEQFDLGQIRGVRLTFTDAAIRNGRVYFLASAEDSPDATSDGPVVGVVLGAIEDERVRWAQLVGVDGAPFCSKAEGLAFDPVDPARAWIVTDRDDPDAPSELCVVTLEGPWPHAL